MPSSLAMLYNGVAATELLYVALAVCPFFIYKQSVAQWEAGIWVVPTVDIAYLLASATLIGYSLSFGCVYSNWTVSATFVYLWVAGITTAMCWYQVPVVPTDNSAHYHFVGHLLLCSAIRQHKAALGLIASVTTISLVYISPVYTFLDEMPILAGWSAAYMVFLLVDHEQSRSSASETASPWWQSLLTHVSGPAVIGMGVYIALAQTVSILVERGEEMVSTLQGQGDVSAAMMVATSILGLMVVLVLVQSMTQSPSKIDPMTSAATAGSAASNTSSIPNLHTATLVLNLSGTAIAMVDAHDRTVKVLSDAFTRMVQDKDANGAPRTLQGLALEHVLLLSTVEATRLQTWFQASLTDASNRTATFPFKDSVMEVNVAPGPTSTPSSSSNSTARIHTVVVVLKNITEEQAAEQEAQKARHLIETLESLPRAGNNRDASS